MTQSFVTQCPHCRTSFRVNLAQLGAAHGAVRCGACLHVFNAAQQLREQGQQLPPPAAPAAAPAPAPAPQPSKPPAPPAPPQAVPSARPAIPAAPTSSKASDTLWIHDDLDLDSLDLDEELAKLEAQEQQLSKQFLAIDSAPKYNEGFLTPEPVEHDPHDERWAEALLQDELSKPAASLSVKPQPLTPPARLVPPAPATPEPVNEPDDEPPFDLNSLDRRHPEPEIEHIELHGEREPFGAPADSPRDEAPAVMARKKTARSEPELRDEHLFELDDEPLQLDWQQPKKPWGRWIGWGLLNLLGAAALAGQYVMYHFNELARQDQYRPWFEQLCPAVGCQLPSKVDITQVKSSNLVVRSHPEFSGALVVDAILYNRAAFSQPFPLLEMRFADINGQLLASRRFKPSEYLAGELAGNAEMPPQTPIHISLDILDPGTQAVNYSLSFHSPE
ncbi:DUF3426 domain-containing protein [Pseudomonas anguilliseptica]|uniref:DUF3426 domain-containing protein n=1 Tax=Pseudomonas anguilliseptica TaxID=53406 RepID=UPI0022B01B64|nr:DUF3426 domain-containing protein [Pseudomonas anguilliseptica]MCZ4321012.1 zinc-ribbon domain-containing protein [Pseudomonas anguilliseptica]